MGTNNVVFLEVIEWFDETGQELVHRIPETGSGEVKYGAQLVVRPSQLAVFFYNGKAVHAFRQGRHTLQTANIPILNKIMSIPWGMTSPLRAETYFVNIKEFPNLKWGTRDPVAFKDSELGLIRLRTFGVFNIRVIQPVLFINRLVGTQGIYTTQDIEDYLSRVIVSRFNDYLGEHLDSILNLPGEYDEISAGLANRLRDDFSHYGLGLTKMYINAITPPPEVQKAIDDKSRLSVFDDLNQLVKMKAAMAIEKSSENQGEAGAGLGMGLGFMMPSMMYEYFKSGGPSGGGPSGSGSPNGQITCPDCKGPVSPDSQFCPSCGHQLVVFTQCPKCSKNLPPNAKFCSRCGAAVESKPDPKTCPKCGTENLPESVFCNHCGERI